MTHTTLPQMPNHAPQKPKAKRKWLVPLLIVAALLTGLAVGAAKPAPDPVTVTVPGPERVVEKEKRVEVPVTPPSCLTALEHAGEIIDISGGTIGILSDALTAAGSFDVAGINAATVKVKAQTTKLSGVAPGYMSARDECQASAK